MKVNEMIIRDFQPDDGMEDEGSEIQAVVIDLFVEATSDWNAKEYLMALLSLRHRIDTYIDSAESFVAEGE